MAEHEAKAVTEVGPPPLSTNYAYCQCGWRGPHRNRRAEAEADAQDHNQENK